MKNIFDFDNKDLFKLQQFMFKAPKQFQAATANVLTSLSFKTRENDIKILHSDFVIRADKFVGSSLRVTMARNTRIDNQKSNVYSVKRPRFTGWEEQETGKKAKRKRIITKDARGGNIRNRAKSKARLSSKNAPYKPESFKGRNTKGKFMFMMRFLGNKGGGLFLLSRKINTNKGSLGRGLYQLKKNKIQRLQIFDDNKQPKRTRWRTRSIRKLTRNNEIKKVWNKSLDIITKRAGLKRIKL